MDASRNLRLFDQEEVTISSNRKYIEVQVSGGAINGLEGADSSNSMGKESEVWETV